MCPLWKGRSTPEGPWPADWEPLLQSEETDRCVFGHPLPTLSHALLFWDLRALWFCFILLLQVLKWVLWSPMKRWVHSDWVSFVYKALLLWRVTFSHVCFDLVYFLVSRLSSSHWEVSAKGALCHTYTLCYKNNSVSGIIALNKIYEHSLKWTPQSYFCMCLLHQLSLSRSTVVCHGYN